MTRAEKIAKATELRARGKAWTYERIGRELGVSMSTVYDWLRPDYAERHRARSQAWKDRNRAAVRAANMRRWAGVKCRHCRKPTGAIDEAGEPCCRACRAEHEQTANKATTTCDGCGERMLVATRDGLCGFCREERYLGIAA